MSASKSAKEIGLKNLNEVSEISKVSPQTLNNWYNNKKELFNVVLLGCLKIKQKYPKCFKRKDF